jgi:hypothetical protein
MACLFSCLVFFVSLVFFVPGRFSPAGTADAEASDG